MKIFTLNATRRLEKIYVYSLFSLPPIRSINVAPRPLAHAAFRSTPSRCKKHATHLIGTHDSPSFATQLKLTQSKRLEEGKRELTTIREIKTHRHPRRRPAFPAAL